MKLLNMLTATIFLSSVVAVPGAFAAGARMPKETAQQKFDNKSDIEKGAAQLKAQSDGRIYADPGRQKALNDAMNGDSSAASSDTTKASPKPKTD